MKVMGDFNYGSTAPTKKKSNITKKSNPKKKKKVKKFVVRKVGLGYGLFGEEVDDILDPSNVANDAYAQTAMEVMPEEADQMIAESGINYNQEMTDAEMEQLAEEAASEFEQDAELMRLAEEADTELSQEMTDAEAEQIAQEAASELESKGEEVPWYMTALSTAGKVLTPAVKAAATTAIQTYVAKKVVKAPTSSNVPTSYSNVITGSTRTQSQAQAQAAAIAAAAKKKKTGVATLSQGTTTSPVTYAAMGVVGIGLLFTLYKVLKK